MQLNHHDFECSNNTSTLAPIEAADVLFPNPSDGRFFILDSELVQKMTIYDSYGKLILLKDRNGIPSSIDIDVPGIFSSKSIYVVWNIIRRL